MTIVDELRNDLLEILNGVSKSPIPQDNEKCFKVILSNESLFFPYSIENQYGNVLRTLRALSNRSTTAISDKEIESKLTSFLTKLKYSDSEKSVKNGIDGHIIGLIDSIKTAKPQKYIFIVPVMNLTLEEDMEIGDSSVVTLSEKLLAELESESKVKFSPKYQVLPGKQIDYLYEMNKTITYCIVKVDATDYDKAMELALEKTETCLNFLRLFSPDTTPSFVIRKQFRPNVPLMILQVNVDHKLYNELVIHENEMVNHFPTTIPKEWIVKAKTDYLPIINAFLEKPETGLTDLQKTVLTAITWLGDGAKEKERKMKFLKCIMALETILVPDGGKAKQEVIAKRFSSIVFANASDLEKKEAFNEMKNLYCLRNSIIHSGQGYVDKDTLGTAVYWSKITIRILLLSSNKYSTLQEAISNEFPVNEALYTKDLPKGKAVQNI